MEAGTEPLKATQMTSKAGSGEAVTIAESREMPFLFCCCCNHLAPGHSLLCLPQDSSLTQKQSQRKFNRISFPNRNAAC